MNLSLKIHKVFVYGTLKRGEPNHHWFSKEEGFYKLLCHAQTMEKYPLVIATKYNIPFLLNYPGVGHYIKGEVYEVDGKVLKVLDHLEDHPNFYVRETYDVKSIDGNPIDTMKAWIYVMKSFKPELLEKPHFDIYNSNGSHGLRFMEKFERNYDYKSDILL